MGIHRFSLWNRGNGSGYVELAGVVDVGQGTVLRSICKYVDLKSLLNWFRTITNFCIAFFRDPFSRFVFNPFGLGSFGLSPNLSEDYSWRKGAVSLSEGRQPISGAMISVLSYSRRAN
jgi:hypothetical protein